MAAMRALPPPLLALLLVPSAPAAPAELKVGFLLSQTEIGWHAESFSLFKLALQDVNADPNVLPNHTLTYAFEDTAGTPMGALKGTERLLSQSVVGVIGSDRADSVMGMMSYGSLKRTPILNPFSVSTDHVQKSSYNYLFRTAPGDAPALKGMAVLVYALGWRRLGVLVNDMMIAGYVSEMQSAAEKLGVRSHRFPFPPQTGGAQSRQKLDEVIESVAKSGCLVLALYASDDDSPEVLASSYAAGLTTSKYTWLMQEQTYLGTRWFYVPNVLLAARFDHSESTAKDEFLARWPTVSTRYDPEVHGEFDPETKLPFYNSTSNRIWDASATSLGGEGDGKPDRWALLVYDTTRMLASALHQLIEAGGQPSNGTALRAALLDSSLAGITGPLSFDSNTLDRKAYVSMFLLRAGYLPHWVATTTGTMYLSLDSPDWCRGGCQDDSTYQCGSRCLYVNDTLAAIPWVGGSQPRDGRNLDISKTWARFRNGWEGGDQDGPNGPVSHPKDHSGKMTCWDECADSPGTVECARCVKFEAQYDLFTLSAIDQYGRQVQGHSYQRRIKYRSWYYGGKYVRVLWIFPGRLEGLGKRTFTVSLMYAGQHVATGNMTLVRSNCPVGTYEGTNNPCEQCLPGTAAPEMGRLNCTLCAVGKAQPSFAQSTCVDCPTGAITVTEGRSSCEPCSLGRFTAQPGSSTCLACPAPMTTLAFGGKNITDCVCPAGTYRPVAATLALGMTSFPCEQCPKGMQCKAAADERRLLPGADVLGPEAVAPTLLPDYWSTAAAPMSAYRCLGGSLQCPGGKPETCGPQWGDYVCAVCDPGYYSEGGICAKCPSSGVSSVLFPIVPLVVGLGVVVPYYKLHVDKGVRSWNQDGKVAGHILALLLAHVQLGGLLLACNLQLPQAGSTSDFWAQMNYPAGLLQLECVGVRSFQAKLAVGLVQPAWACGMFGLFLLGSKLLKLCTGKDLIDKDVVFSCMGSLFLAFYITICAMSLDLFKCYEHPNKERSVVSAPQVICGSGDWTGMVAVAALGAVVYCGFTMAIFIYALHVAPRFRKDAGFQKRWKFLLARFRPLERWWGIMWLVKGLLLNCVQVALVDGQNQLVAFQSILTIYGVLVGWRQPWRHYSVNAVDAMVHLLQALAGALLFWYATVDDTVDYVRALMVEKLMLPIPLCLLLAFVLAKKLWDQRRVRIGKQSTVTSKSVDRYRRVFQIFVDYDLAEAADLMACVSPLDRELFISFCIALRMEPLFREHASQLEFMERLTSDSGKRKSLRHQGTGVSEKASEKTTGDAEDVTFQRTSPYLVHV